MRQLIGISLFIVIAVFVGYQFIAGCVDQRSTSPALNRTWVGLVSLEAREKGDERTHLDLPDPVAGQGDSAMIVHFQPIFLSFISRVQGRQA